MKYIIPFLFLLIASSSLAQQKESFDLATYTIPAGWKKTNNTANVVGYTVTNNQQNTYCQIGIYTSTTSKGSLQADFESEWQELIIKTYKPTTKPELQPAVSENGWDIQSGVATFEFSGGQSAAMLVTATSHGRCMSIVILTNTEDYEADIEKFLESVDLKKVEPSAQPVDNAGDNSSILGTWSMSSSNQSSYRVNNGLMNYIIRQYTFKSNGTYSFTTKTFDPLMNKILLGKENGVFQINGNNLIVTPEKSVLEAWSKKNGTDSWGGFLETQNIALEKVTYQFTKHYFSGIQVWNLVLQASPATKRDGPYANTSTFTNAWLYAPVSDNAVIKLPN